MGQPGLERKNKDRESYRPVTLLSSGAPGTGKSAVQRLAPGYFRARLGMAAAMGTDDIYQIIDPDWSRIDDSWKHIARDNCLVLARNLFSHGMRVVLIAGAELHNTRVVNQFLARLLPISAVFHYTLDAQLGAGDRIQQGRPARRRASQPDQVSACRSAVLVARQRRIVASAAVRTDRLMLRSSIVKGDASELQG